MATVKEVRKLQEEGSEAYTLPGSPAFVSQEEPEPAAVSPPAKLSIREMKACIVEAGLNTDDLVERPHVEERYREALAKLKEEEPEEEPEVVSALPTPEKEPSQPYAEAAAAGSPTGAYDYAREWAKPAFAPLPLPSAPVVALAPLQAPRPASEQERLHGVYSASTYPFGDDEDDTRHENLKRKAPAGGSEDAPAPAKRRVSDVHDAALKKRACEVVNLAFEQNRKQLARETKGCEETPEEWLFDVMEGDAMECLGMRARVCEVEPMAAYVQPHSCIYEHTLVFRAARGKLELVRWSV